MGVCNCSMLCCTLLYDPSSFAIILMGKRELVALLSLSSWCLVIVVWLFLAVPWVCLQFVVVVFPDHTHLLFQRTAARWACRRWRTRVVSAKCSMSLNGHLSEPVGISPPCFFFTRFIEEQCLYMTPLPGHHIVLSIVDTRHTVMP